MKKVSCIFLMLLWVLSIRVDAQRWKSQRYEAYFGMGTSHLYGDIGGAMTSENLYGLKDIDLVTTRPSFAFGAAYRFNQYIYFRSNFAVGHFAGNDIGSKNEFTRDYSYTSTVFEPSLQCVFFILPENRAVSSGALYNRRGMINKIGQFFVYVFGGGGAVLNFPTVRDIDGNVITTDRYAPEDAEFKRIGLVFPAGVGVKYHISPYVLATLEFGRRYTLTDYVDGYTSRYSTSYDVYDLTILSLVYKIETNRKGLPVMFGR